MNMFSLTPRSVSRLAILLQVLLLGPVAVSAVTVTIDPAETGPAVDLADLLGTNMALWYEPDDIAKPGFMEHLKAWGPGLVRLPGGSWSNEYYWNGNGVRTGWDTFNHDKFVDGRWQVDYSGYAPGFRIHGVEQHLSDYHGVIDVKREHQIAEELGADQLVTVNVGTGDTRMAVEWLKWAREEGFSVPYWEIGNELNGQWEVGHFLPDGTGMTGEIYARRYLEYSRALKEVDPSVRTGGPACSDLNLAFVEELIRDAGDELDFVSIHAYPVGVQRVTVEEKFADIDLLRDALTRVRGWKKQYQPDRVGQIGIGITEWNMKVNEDRDTADIINGLWSAAWIGAMMEGGVTFSNQWDLMTTTAEGGHGAFFLGEERLVPKSHYWAHYLWGHFMGGTVIGHSIEGGEWMEIFTTRTQDAIQVMLINKSPDNEQAVKLILPEDLTLADEGRRVTFSRQEYFWDPHQHKPLWSMKPTVASLDTSHLDAVTVPAFTIQILQLPLSDDTVLPCITERVVGTPSLKLVLPETSPADLPLEAWVAAVDADNGGPYLGELGPVNLSIEGPAESDSEVVELSQSVGQVFIQPSGAGELHVAAVAGDLHAVHTVRLQAVESRPVVIWTFDNAVEDWGASGTFDLGMEPSVKPNEFVAESIMVDALPGNDADVLLLLEKFPEDLPIDRIGGIIGEIQVSPELVTSDPDAAVNIILQSEADHWMQLVSIPFSEMTGDWMHYRFEIDDPRLLKAMARLYAVRFQVVSTEPVTGDIYFDNLGFLIRN